jgi:HlyD family secretion protein
MGNRKKISIIVVVVLILVIATTALYFSGIFFPTYLKSGSFTTATVERGDVVLTSQATGTVESESEVIILSPASSIVKSILKEPGTRVERGETIILLDTEPVENEIQNLKDRLEMRKNSLEKNRLNALSTRLDLDYNEEVKKLKITSLKSQLADQEQLLEVGGISPARLEQTKQEITLAEKDLQMLIEKNSIRLKQMEADEKGLLLQIRIDEKELENKQELLTKMKVTAPSSGIILNIQGREGEKIGADKTLVRMSDLTAFKIMGSIDEQNATQLKTGKKVMVLIDNEQLEGTIGNITPVVENDKAEKKEISLGVKGNKFCEVASGLSEGDVIITDGMNAYRQHNEIEIRK